MSAPEVAGICQMPHYNWGGSLLSAKPQIVSREHRSNLRKESGYADHFIWRFALQAFAQRGPATVRGYLRVACSAAPKAAAFIQEPRSSRPMYRSVDTSAAKKALVGCVHDRVGLFLCEVTLFDYDAVSDSATAPFISPKGEGVPQE
jgi:hypothetical protein